VSAYIPCYNNIDTIAEAVNSIRRQKVAVGELFVIDDGSTNGSAEVVESMGVRVIRNERNLGRGAVRNRAMTEAKNELVLCCDATNILTPDFLEKALL
jgi:glycosyltransferase involved in cell wall biosynthesis